MAGKTPKFVQKALEKFEARQLHYAECLRVKRTLPPENQQLHIREKPEAFFEGMAEGNVAAMNELLMDNNCYHGFNYINADGTPRRLDQDGPDWLIRFYQRT